MNPDADIHIQNSADHLRPSIINVTPHPIVFKDAMWGEWTVAPSGIVINARPEEQLAQELANDIILVTTRFIPTAEGEEALTLIEKANAGHGVLIIGSIIAAQAYPGRVLAMTPVPGFERVPPAEKRMNPRKFTTYARE
jgi:hypothetical protein